MKTIAIDCRFASTLSGLGRYTRELTTCLLKNATDIRYVLIVQSKDEEWIPKTDSRLQIVPANIPHYSFAEQCMLPSVIRLTGADLLFAPHFNVPHACPIPFVVTVHDLILHRYPNDASFLNRIAYRTLINHAVTHAKAVCTVSDFVSSEIRETYGSAIAAKTHVIREGVSEIYHPASDVLKDNLRKKYGLRRPFFLYVGNAKQHKNVQVLLDAFVEAGETGRDFILLTGEKEWKRYQKIPPNVRALSNIPDAELPVFYSLADALFTATLYEGYCLPVAEALACGCPVVASDLSVIREIAEGHATFIEPSVQNFALEMKKQHAHTFPFTAGTWQKAAEETENILSEAVASL